MTSQGSGQGRFQRACEGGDVVKAELAAKELGYMSLPNALQLVCVYAAAESPKFDAAAVRFLCRLTKERPRTSLGTVLLMAAALVELRGDRREEAARTLVRLL